MVSSEQYLREPTRAASHIICNSLCVRRRDQILLVFDRYGQEVADAFIEAALILRQHLLPVYAPYDTQVGKGITSFKKLLMAHISESVALITCLNESDEATDFRRALVDTAVKANVLCIHMPGVNETTLVTRTLDLDLKALDRRATSLARALSNAERVRIVTQSRDGAQEHALMLNIRGRLGHADGGIARRGHIINMPTGEAYIAPLEKSARGSIVINGSFPGCDLSKGEEVILVFNSGILDLDASNLPSNTLGDDCRNLLQSACGASRGRCQVGELGLGLNPTVRTANGSTIVDEKAFGSAHIALGSNTTFGGKDRSPYHHDLVFYPHAIYLDGTLLVNEWHTPKRRLWEE